MYASVNGLLGPELALALHGEDWRDHQARVTRECLEDESARACVAEAGGAHESLGYGPLPGVQYFRVLA